MRSIPLALTWEFWRQTGFALFTTVTLLSGIMGLIYGGLRLDRFANHNSDTTAGLHMICFIFIVISLAATICHSAGSPHYRFTLPVSIRTSILVPMINGAIACAIGYLTIAFLMNGIFRAEWTLIKPTAIAVCMMSVCHAFGWLLSSSSNLRFGMVAVMSTGLGVAVIHLNGIQSQSPEQVPRQWQTLRPLDISLAIIVPLLAYLFSFVVLTLARRGQVFSMSTLGRWLLAKFDIKFSSDAHATTPMAAELWSEWTVRGRVMPAGALLVTVTMCSFFLSGRFEWESARDGIMVFTWLQVILGSLIGLFLGHVGPRFDFHEHLATRTLSDIQLADVKLRNALKSVLCTWVTWAIGVAVAVLCLSIVGQGPKTWSDIVPPGTHPVLPIFIVAMIPLCSWTLTSFGVSIAILRPWLILTLFSAIALLPAVPFVLLLLMPEDDVGGFLRWSWIGVSIVGTIALYLAAFSLRLITAKRIAVIIVAYLILSGAWLLRANYFPPAEAPFTQLIGVILSTCTLPFVCVAAVPLAVWWNRHR